MDEQEKSTEVNSQQQSQQQQQQQQPQQNADTVKPKKKKKESFLVGLLKIVGWFAVIVLLIFLTLYITTLFTEFNSIGELINYLLGHL